jgi:hypothetical protein
LPPGAEDTEVYRGARSGYLVTVDNDDWQKIYARELAASVHPPPRPLAAE